jgi:hypothetical protein
VKHRLATDASDESPPSDLLLHELTPTNLDFPPSASSTLCPKIWVQYTVQPQLAHRRIALLQPPQQDGSGAVLQLGGVDEQHQQDALAIHREVALAPLYLLGAVIAFGPPCMWRVSSPLPDLVPP